MNLKDNRVAASQPPSYAAEIALNPHDLVAILAGVRTAINNLEARK